jgi:hypothetical protein
MEERKGMNGRGNVGGIKEYKREETAEVDVERNRETGTRIYI